MSYMNLCRTHILAEYAEKNKPLRSVITYLFITFHERSVLKKSAAKI